MDPFIAFLLGFLFGGLLCSYLYQFLMAMGVRILVSRVGKKAALKALAEGIEKLERK